MEKIIECIPNFSEGQNQKTIDAIITAISNVNGIIFLDSKSDPAHNRSVVTFAGKPEDVVEAAFEGCKKAAELIDMNKHKGEHPRMGAMDVCPFVPLKGLTYKECIEYAEKLGKRIGTELGIPVYLYEKAAHRPKRKNLADIRKGEYEGIRDEIQTNPNRKPDFGPMKMPKAGATAVGVRAPLIAYNVNLKTRNLSISKAIAKKIRFKDGGFPCVKAMGFDLADRNIVQISMNLTDYRVTPIHTIFDAIKKECKAHGVEIIESEIIGLVPQDALTETSKHYLKITNFSNKQILENILQEKLAKQSLEEFLDQVASKSPVPGGGSVCALVGTLAAGLNSMVCNLTLSNKKYKSSHHKINQLLRKSEKLRTRLFQLIEEDAQAYQKVVDAYKSKKTEKIQESLKKAATTPLEIAQTAAKILESLKVLDEEGNQNAASDCGVAKLLIEAVIKGAILNIQINLQHINDKTFENEAAKNIAILEDALK